MAQKSEAQDTETKLQYEASRVNQEAVKHAYKAYEETKKQADIVYKEAKKIAVDKGAQQEADKAHKEAYESGRCQILRP